MVQLSNRTSHLKRDSARVSSQARFSGGLGVRPFGGTMAVLLHADCSGERGIVYLPAIASYPKREGRYISVLD